MIHDPLPIAVDVDVYKAVALCSCGERLVEYGHTAEDARDKALRARTAHLASKGAAS